MSIIDPADTGTSYAAMTLFQPPTAHKAIFQSALDKVVSKIEALVPTFGLRNPRLGVPGSLKYEFCTEDEWVASFWPGQLWLAYSLTGDERLKNSARARRGYFQNVLENPAWHDHDLGFLFSLTSVADHKLTGDTQSRDTALRAAELLAARWRQPMSFVMCWNPMRRDPPEFVAQKTGTLNIDSLQGMALLYWAHRMTGQKSFLDIANMHNETAIKYLMRDDFSSFHCYEFDPRTGDPVQGYTHQGLSDDSCWSRGQAWAIHGLAQSYLNTGIEAYRDTSAAMADYISDRLPEDGVPLWDYDLPADRTQYRDTSAGSITAAGIYALARGFGEGPEGKKYTALADRILLGLVQNYDVSGDDASEGLLKEGAAYVDIGRADNLLPYGDYYYVEALMRSVGHTEFFW